MHREVNLNQKTLYTDNHSSLKKLYPKRNLEGVIAFGKIQRDADVGLMSIRWWRKLREESADNSVVKDK